MLTRRNFLTSTALLGVAAAMPAFAGDKEKIGSFKGKSNHITTGRAKLVVSGDKAQVVLSRDFTFDGAPDPKVALGANGYDKRTLMGKLKKNKGSQSYVVPANVDASKYNEVWIWCEKFNVPLGVAKLQ